MRFKRAAVTVQEEKRYILLFKKKLMFIFISLNDFFKQGDKGTEADSEFRYKVKIII